MEATNGSSSHSIVYIHTAISNVLLWTRVSSQPSPLVDAHHSQVEGGLVMCRVHSHAEAPCGRLHHYRV